MVWWKRGNRGGKSLPENLVSLSDPALADYFGVSSGVAGVHVNQHTALAVSAVWRAVNLISGTIASLPLKVYSDGQDGTRRRVPSFLESAPAGPDSSLTPYEWKQVVVAQILLRGRALLTHVRNQGGVLIGLQPLEMDAATTDPPGWLNGRLRSKTFTATLSDGRTRTLTEGEDVTEIMGFSLDGWHALSVLSVARRSLGTSIAGDSAAARMFSSGALMAGLVTPEEDITREQAEEIVSDLQNRAYGHENAGKLAFVNRKLKFTPWTLSAEDAQFIQSRQFQIEEIARWFGIPPFELMQTEKQTSWGTGIEAQQRGLARGNLLGWTMRIEQRITRLLSASRFSEFDFSALERPTPEQEIRLLIEQVNGGLLTVNEARKTRNLSPLPGGDRLKGTGERFSE